ncbi:DUF2683 family protein [Peijinzhouia sedimentorum]
MKLQNVFIAHPKTKEQENALKAFMKALKIKFEVTDEVEYNQEFVNEILKSREEGRSGKVTRVKKENLKEFFDL